MTGKIIVVGNEKGGTGKSTVAMHLIVAFLNLGKCVSSVDLDGTQGTLTHYIENRVSFAKMQGLSLSIPEHFVMKIEPETPRKDIDDAIDALNEELDRMQKNSDIVIVDTAGAPSLLSFAAHTRADILLTPLNDSLADLDVLAKIDLNSLTVKSPGRYAQLVWKARQQRALAKKTSLKWFVLRNRQTFTSGKNARLIGDLLNALSSRIVFSSAGGLKERLIYRELFLKGLTVLDPSGKKTGFDLTMSHLAARQEIRTLVNVLSA